MEVLNYGKIKDCYVCGSICEEMDSFIAQITKGLSNVGEPFVHPKEKERLERLKRESTLGEIGGGGRVSMRTLKQVKFGKNFDNTVIIVSGNCGIGTKSIDYYENKFKHFNEDLKKNNCHVLFVRGNMDDPSFFEGDKFNLSNIKCLKDYTVVQFKNFDCLCVGGAFSLDRSWKIKQGKRLGKQTYWENEKVCYDEKALDEIVNNFKISLVVTCASPSFTYPSLNTFVNSKWVKEDKDTLQYIVEERQLMDKIYSKLFNKNGTKPYCWFYGKYGERYNGLSNDISFISLTRREIVSFSSILLNNFGVEISDNMLMNGENIPSSSKKTKSRFTTARFLEDGINFNDYFARRAEAVEEDIMEVGDEMADGDEMALGDEMANGDEMTVTINNDIIGALNGIAVNDIVVNDMTVEEPHPVWRRIN